MLKPHITIFLKNGNTLRFYEHKNFTQSDSTITFTYVSESDGGLKSMNLSKHHILGISICDGHGR